MGSNGSKDRAQRRLDSSRSPSDVLRDELGELEACFERVYHIEGEGQLATAVTRVSGRYRVSIVTNIRGPLILHWGVARQSPYDWFVPEPSSRPPGTTIWQNKAARTLLTLSAGLSRLTLEFSEKKAPLGVPFVLREVNTGRWIGDSGGNFYVAVDVDKQETLVPRTPELAALAAEFMGLRGSGPVPMASTPPAAAEEPLRASPEATAVAEEASEGAISPQLLEGALQWLVSDPFRLGEVEPITQASLTTNLSQQVAVQEAPPGFPAEVGLPEEIAEPTPRLDLPALDVSAVQEPASFLETLEVTEEVSPPVVSHGFPMELVPQEPALTGILESPPPVDQAAATEAIHDLPFHIVPQAAVSAPFHEAVELSSEALQSQISHDLAADVTLHHQVLPASLDTTGAEAAISHVEITHDLPVDMEAERAIHPAPLAPASVEGRLAQPEVSHGLSLEGLSPESIPAALAKGSLPVSLLEVETQAELSHPALGERAVVESALAGSLPIPGVVEESVPPDLGRDFPLEVTSQQATLIDRLDVASVESESTPVEADYPLVAEDEAQHEVPVAEDGPTEIEREVVQAEISDALLSEALPRESILPSAEAAESAAVAEPVLSEDVLAEAALEEAALRAAPEPVFVEDQPAEVVETYELPAELPPVPPPAPPEPVFVDEQPVQVAEAHGLPAEPPPAPPLAEESAPVADEGVEVEGPSVQPPAAPRTLEEAVKEELGERVAAFERVYDLDGQGQLAVAVSQADERYQVVLIANVTEPLILHWGVARHSAYEWLPPDPSLQPEGTTVWQSKAAQTPFILREGLSRLKLELPEQEAPLGLAFVLKQPETGTYFKNRGENFYVPIAAPARAAPAPGVPQFASLTEEIIKAEVSRNSWTLMHRFDLCYDLLDRVGDDLESQALLFVWLRFSAIRQLDWQRNYNTKPRELSHAQDRLTSKLADLYFRAPASRWLLRLMMTTVGPGGDGQQIRDEILGIMHRHNIKEVPGNFLEEWHQKLHNNTTPDDVVICNAYLEFLQTHGNLAVFYGSLEKGGVTKARLESFERPITTPPTFTAYLKEVMIEDFQHFLRILKSIHSADDLESAINRANPLLDRDTRSLLADLWQDHNDQVLPLVLLVDQITQARRRLQRFLSSDQGVRDVLYLDLALERFLRLAIERNLHLALVGDQLVDLITKVMENLLLSCDDPELGACFRHWERLRGRPRFGRDWSLHADAVLDRIRRYMGAMVDRYRELFQPKAELLGRAVQAEDWTIKAFSEAAVRGSPSFSLSTLLYRLNPVLRKLARLGDWQVVSPVSATGQVAVTDALKSVQGKVFDQPTVLVADKAAGEEEIPENVTGVVVSTDQDVLSHLSVRARNAGVFFGACYDAETFKGLKSLDGKAVEIAVSAKDGVSFKSAGKPEGPARTKASAKAPAGRPGKVTSPEFTVYAVASSAFTEKVVGGKSHNLARLEGKLPAWIHLPHSVALPYGVFEHVLALKGNKEVAERYRALIPQVEKDTANTLAQLRQAVLELATPAELKSALRKVMDGAHLPWPSDWEDAWTCIKTVWASKWNDRAYFSRKARGISHESLSMAVLVQQLVEAEYAFVIHTVNPVTRDKNELYGEVVVGMGETLVGNYPGRALGFTCDKKSSDLTVTAYPGKSVALKGNGLIFRSDSNGEDLPGYSGAGLHDSVTLKPPLVMPLDCTEEPLIWDEGFRNKLLLSIAKVGLAIEKAFGAPQDIEGAYSKGDYYVVQARPQVGLE